MSARHPLNRRAEVVKDAVYLAMKVTHRHRALALKTALAQVAFLKHELENELNSIKPEFTPDA